MLSRTATVLARSRPLHLPITRSFASTTSKMATSYKTVATDSASRRRGDKLTDRGTCCHRALLPGHQGQRRACGVLERQLTGQFIFASGSIPLDPKTMTVVEGGITEQTVSVGLAGMAAVSCASYCSGTSQSSPIAAWSCSAASASPADHQEQVFANIAAVLAESGANKSTIVKTTCFIKDMNDFVKFNEVYSKFFGEYKPARSCVEVARLPKDVLVEVEFIATEA